MTTAPTNHVFRETQVVDPQLREYLAYVANVDHELAEAVRRTASRRSWTVLHSTLSAPQNLLSGGTALLAGSNPRSFIFDLILRVASEGGIAWGAIENFYVAREHKLIKEFAQFGSLLATASGALVMSLPFPSDVSQVETWVRYMSGNPPAVCALGMAEPREGWGVDEWCSWLEQAPLVLEECCDGESYLIGRLRA